MHRVLVDTAAAERDPQSAGAGLAGMKRQQMVDRAAAIGWDGVEARDT